MTLSARIDTCACQELLFCTKISKSDKPSMTKNEDGTINCTYSDPKQLYYIVKIQ